MAEERIFITKIQPECKFRELHETTAGGHTWVDFMCGKSTVKNLECDEKCFEQCEWKELTGISRQEAIEKIAKAICREDNCLDSCEECVLGFGATAEEKEQFCQKQIIMSRDLSASYVCRAEAALDALLGGK
jgi:hypothetical protein